MDGWRSHFVSECLPVLTSHAGRDSKTQATEFRTVVLAIARMTGVMTVFLRRSAIAECNGRFNPKHCDLFSATLRSACAANAKV